MLVKCCDVLDQSKYSLPHWIIEQRPITAHVAAISKVNTQAEQQQWTAYTDIISGKNVWLIKIIMHISTAMPGSYNDFNYNHLQDYTLWLVGSISVFRHNVHL